MKKCDFCKSDCPDGSLFCPYCGAKFESGIYCNNCGTENDIDAKFCCRCGKAIAASSEPIPPVKKAPWGIIWAAFFAAFIIYASISLFI